MEFHEWLKAEMEGKGWTAQELARRSDIDPATMSNMLSKARKPGAEVCRKLAAAFGVEQWVAFRVAGLLTEDPANTAKQDHPVLGSINRELSLYQDDTEYLEMVLAMLRAMGRKRRKGDSEAAAK